MIYLLSITIALAIGFLAGNFRRETVESIKDIKSKLSHKRDKPVEDSRKSTFIDPLDPVTEAKRRFEEQMEDLNRYE